MTLTSVFGLIAMALVWIAGLSALAWSWRRSVLASGAAGIEIPEEVRRLKSGDVVRLNVRRHTLKWTAFFLGLFLVMEAIDLPLWARLGMALVLGAYYGSVRITNEDEKHGRRLPPVVSPSLDKLWLPGVATLEWFGYLGVLVFIAQLVGELVFSQCQPLSGWGFKKTDELIVEFFIETQFRMTGRLIVERAPNGWVDRFRAYEVVVDDEPRAKLWRGETQEMSVEPGEVEIFLRIDWCKSRTLRVHASPGSETRLTCRPRSIRTAIYGITFGRHNYVHLERISHS